MDMVELVGLGGRENYFPRELSGGQQQRVGIARSLAIEPDIWFLDEPFSALDPLIRKEMQDEFLRLQGVLNKTILFVTHDFDEALRLADRIAIMKDGVIEQLDTPANIVLNPATDYVHKFTAEVPREKVLKIESVMEPIKSSDDIGDLRVSKDAIIETVAEAVLNESKAVSVVDDNNRVVGVLHPSKVISVLFGGRANPEPVTDPRGTLEAADLDEAFSVLKARGVEIDEAKEEDQSQDQTLVKEQTSATVTDPIGSHSLPTTVDPREPVSNTIDRVEIEKRKLTMLGVLAGSLAMGGVGYLLLYMNVKIIFFPGLGPILGLLGIGFSLIGVVCSVWMLFSRKVGLIIDENGITNYSGIKGGLIKWDGIEGVVVEEVEKQKFISFVDKNGDTLKGRGYSIHANNLKYDFLALVELIEHNIEKANNLRLE